MNPHSPEAFAANTREALGDAHLRGALDNATELFAERRSKAIGTMPDWEDLRERARLVKEHTLARLDHYLLQFVERAEARGVQVHWARDATEACAVLAELVARGGARRLVKSKSMTTEEIGLNDALERDGTLPIETDLGEWIIQLAGETPSHIIVPAIHKTKAQIASLFVEKLEIAKTENVEVLTATARGVLRQHFAEADLGISGVNFAVAETGTFLVLENEGNARMTTSLPRVHVAVMGIEKLLPRLSDLAVFLRLLPRSGTGQHLTSYQSLFTGTVPPGGEGPQEIHVVLLDNGRARMLGERVTRQSLACIRCGACLNACPVYRSIGGHAYGSVYPGPIGAVITPQLGGLERAAELPFASSLCGACREVCPVKIDLPELLLDLRSRIVEGRPLPQTAARAPQSRRLERWAFRLWAATVTRPSCYRALSRLARWLPGLDGRGFVGCLLARWIRPLGAWTAGRELAPPAQEPLHRILRARGRRRP